MSRFGDLVRGKVTPEPAPVVEETSTPKRARTSKGHYAKDDPSTPENEAWVGGKAPSKKKKKTWDL
tara:strand:+ start:4352 stop:4549 length:198 start_codon:yes stop_codon:yes gene_type:complete